MGRVVCSRKIRYRLIEFGLSISRSTLPVLEEKDEKDIAASLVNEYASLWDPSIERRLVREIDLFLIPIMWVGYGLVYYDKVSLFCSLWFTSH